MVLTMGSTFVDPVLSLTLTLQRLLEERDIPNYWAYARDFVLADRYFTSVHGPVFRMICSR
jgi:hypothetical protein